MKCKTCPSRKHCWDYGDCDSCELGKYIIKQHKRIEKLKKLAAALQKKIPKRSFWKDTGHYGDHYRMYECMSCHSSEEGGSSMRYCPNCGAKMDGEEDMKQ
jgi:hypothetical protein